MSAKPVFVADHSKTKPQLIAADGSPTWLTAGANFVISISQVKAGTVLVAESIPDESMVFLSDCAAVIEAGEESVTCGDETLVIIPPGRSRVTAQSEGRIVRIFSSRARELYGLAPNAANYLDKSPELAPLQDGPMPDGGYRLRSYRLTDYGEPGSNMRVFRSTNLMINPLKRRDVARDVATLSPHSHADFEQASVVLEGSYIHHARYPWTADMREWREDEHLAAGTPSVTIIPATVVHTSRNIDGPGYLIDVFAPPRVDFERRGIVCNAEDYPAFEESLKI